MSQTVSPIDSGNLSLRQSQSAPVLLAFDRLISSTLSLSHRVSALGVSVRASRSSFSLPSSPSRTMSTTATAKQRTCHACHAPVSLHTEIPTGLSKCPLPHWDGCQGGYVDGKAANGKEWRGCPLDFVPGSPSPQSDEESEKDAFEDTQSHIDVTEERTDDVFTDEGETVKSANESIKIDENKTKSKDGSPDPDAVEQELLDLQARNKLLRQQFARHQAQKVEQDNLEKVRLLKMVEAENKRLVEQMDGDTGGAKKRAQQSGNTSLLESHSVPRSSANQNQHVAAAPVSWHHSYQQHLTKNQLKAAQPVTANPPIYKGLDMNGIRKIPHLRGEVENLVEKVQNAVPSLDRRPTAGGDAFLNQQSLGAQTPAFSLPAVEENFIYLRRDDGTIYRVPVMNDNQVVDMSPRTRQVGFEKPPPSHGSRTKCLIAEEDPLVSSDDDCPVVPKPGWRHIWRQAANGEKYFTEEIIPAASEKKYEWVKDEVTGRTSKRLVEIEANHELELRTVIDPSTGREAQMLVPRTPTRLGAAQPLRKQTVSKTPTRVDHRAHLDHLAAAPQYERAPSYIAPTEDKQGKDSKSPVLVQYARNCPVA